jgi:thiamine-monophosphate kinase
MKLDSEDAFLELIDSHFNTQSPLVRLGRGDDCAILSPGGDICVSSDLFLEDVHFRRSYFSAGDIGYKSLAVNISDIAGMGAKPLGFNMDLMIPDNLPEDFWDEFLKSMASLARQNELALTGGDLSRSEKLGINITIFGHGGGKGCFIPRRNARAGDSIFVCGDLGEKGIGAKEIYPVACRTHLRPKMKLMTSSLIAAAGVSSLMDVSDGLARDLPRLVGSDLGVDIVIESSFIHDEITRYCAEKGLDPVEALVLGGEDYALVGTADSDTVDKVRSIPGTTIIGTVTEQNGIHINGKEFTNPGFDHFV